MAQILIVEDHENISRTLKTHIESEGHQVEIAGGIKEARSLLTMSPVPDLILLDWMLGDGQGIDLLKDLRRQGKMMPIIFLTARAELVDKVLGLEMGANDYMTKPFESRELMARIRVQLRDAKRTEENENASFNPGSGQSDLPLIQLGDLIIDRTRYKVSYRGMPIELVKKEFDLLMLFAESPEKVFSRDEILNKVWGYDVFPTTRTVDTHVMLLRQKIQSDLIETVRSVGYRLKIV